MKVTKVNFVSRLGLAAHALGLTVLSWEVRAAKS